MKEFIEKAKTNQIVKRTMLIMLIFILIVIILIIFASCTKRQKVYTYEELETKLVDLTKKRYTKDEYKSKLPSNDKDYLDVNIQSFVEDKTFKSIESLTKKKSICTGYVRIINNNGYYLYVPYLDCGNDYQSKTIYDVLTNENNIVNSGNGLYHINNEYIYKGDTVNNYLKLNGITYRILRINEDGIRVIDLTKRDTSKWDDRYNIDKNTNVGINDYIINNINSRIKDNIESLYNNNSIFNNGMRSYFVNTPLCIGKKSINDNVLDNSIECSNTTISYPFSLITSSEFYQVSLDNNCNSYTSESCLNYNYLIEIGSTWTITADKDTTYKAYKLTTNGINLSNTSTTSNIKIVTTLNKELLYDTGDGSIKNPYVIKSYEEIIKSKK